jgi:uncharacterized protein YybS (DUF2232 family)
VNNRLTQVFKQPLLWCALLIIELLTLLTPISVLTIHLLMIPILMLYMKLDLKRFSLAYISSLFVLFAVMGGSAGGVVLGMLSLFFVPVVVMMGQLYKKKFSAKIVVIAAIGVIISEILVLMVMGYATGLNPIQGLKTWLTEYMTLMPETFRSLMPAGYVDKVALMVPLLMLVFAAYYVLLTHGIARRLFKKSDTPLPPLPSIRLWRLPKSTVWYFLIVIGIGFIIDANSDLYFQMIVFNLLPLFMLVFVAQAIGFMYDYAHWKQRSRVLPAVAIVLIICLPPLLYLASLLGILDVMFPLRRRFTKTL